MRTTCRESAPCGMVRIQAMLLPILGGRCNDCPRRSSHLSSLHHDSAQQIAPEPVSYSGWAPIADGPPVHLLYNRRAPGVVYYIVHGPGVCLLYSRRTATMTGKVVLYYSTMYMYTWCAPRTLEGICVA